MVEVKWNAMSAYSTPFVGKFDGSRVIFLHNLHMTDAYRLVCQRATPPISCLTIGSYLSSFIIR